jgi:hypothetical protein
LKEVRARALRIEHEEDVPRSIRRFSHNHPITRDDDFEVENVNESARTENMSSPPKYHYFEIRVLFGEVNVDVNLEAEWTVRPEYRNCFELPASNEGLHILPIESPLSGNDITRFTRPLYTVGSTNAGLVHVFLGLREV